MLINSTESLQHNSLIEPHVLLLTSQANTPQQVSKNMCTDGWMVLYQAENSAQAVSILRDSIWTM